LLSTKDFANHVRTISRVKDVIESYMTTKERNQSDGFPTTNMIKYVTGVMIRCNLSVKIVRGARN